MAPLDIVRGHAAPLMRINVDTDQIIPSRFQLKGLEPGGLREGLFANWRRDEDGEEIEEFILNRQPYDTAPILLSGRNFGCGSSREYAVRALHQWGIRVVIAPSFGEIFYGNCFRNGVLPVVLTEAIVSELANDALAGADAAVIEVDLSLDRVRDARGRELKFESPARLRQILLSGMDEIDMTMTARDDIQRFRRQDRLNRAWAYTSLEKHCKMGS